MILQVEGPSLQGEKLPKQALYRYSQLPNMTSSRNSSSTALQKRRVKKHPKNALQIIHPGRLTWNIIMEVWKIIFLSKWVICRFHVNLSGCKYLSNFDIKMWVPGGTSSWNQPNLEGWIDSSAVDGRNPVAATWKASKNNGIKSYTSQRRYRISTINSISEKLKLTNHFTRSIFFGSSKVRCSFIRWVDSRTEASKSHLWSFCGEMFFSSAKNEEMFVQCQLVTHPWSLPFREPTYPIKNSLLKMIFLFPRWDMLIPWRVTAPLIF